MINLLPYDRKKQTTAARLNVVLFSYIIILVIAIGFVVLTCAGAYMFLNMTKINNEEQLEHSKTAPVSTSSAQGQVNAFRDSLTTAKSILDQQIVYSDIITGLGALLPQGTKIDSLSLNDGSFGAPMDLKIRATSADLEPKIKEGFSTSALFSSYKMTSTNQEAGSPGYPYVYNISFTINKAAAK